MDFDIYQGACVLSVSEGLRPLGSVKRNIAGTKHLLEHTELCYKSDYGTWFGTAFADTRYRLERFEASMLCWKKTDFRDGENVARFVDDEASRDLVLSSPRRKLLVRDYVQGRAFGYPLCCVRRFLDWNEECAGCGSDYVPWYPCGKDCAPTLDFEKKIREIMRAGEKP